MMDVRSLLKQLFHLLTTPASTVEDPEESWEDRIIRLALKRWIFKARKTVPSWDQIRHIIEIVDG